jgi:hypothetical protein
MTINQTLCRPKNKAKQTQFKPKTNPIQSQFKPKQSQNKPNQTQPALSAVEGFILPALRSPVVWGEVGSLPALRLSAVSEVEPSKCRTNQSKGSNLFLFPKTPKNPIFSLYGGSAQKSLLYFSQLA